MQRRPGEVWFLSPEEHPAGDEKVRRHVLLTSCDAEEDGLLAYASTRSTEASFGAEYLAIDPVHSPHSGFTQPTCVYPGRLVPAAPDDFLRRAGRLESELAQLRTALQNALGLGTGCARPGNAGPTSWRGAIVQLHPDVIRNVAYRFAVVLTEHRYSARHRYQIVVPLEDGAAVDPLPGDLVVENLGWLRQLGWTGAILAIPEIQSLFHRTEITRWTGAVIDNGTMDEVERAVKQVFEL